MANKTLLDLSQLKSALSTFKSWIGSNFLKKDNSTAYTPTANYHPATKKYVDDGISNAAKVYTATTTVSANGTSVITNPLSVAISDSAQVYQNGLLLIKGVNYNINTDGNIALIGATADKDDTFTVVSKATGSDVTITSTAANVTLANTAGYSDNATSVETAINKIGETISFVTSSAVSTFNIQSIVLNASDWDTATKTQTITLTGIVADETKQIIHVSPSTASADNMNLYYDSGIMAIGQSTNSLTFKANKIPTANITVLVSCAAQVTLNKEDNK